MAGVVKFDDKAWGRLASMADAQGITIAQLLEGAAYRLFVGTSRAPRPPRTDDLRSTRAKHKAALVERVKALRAGGRTVAQIADLTGYSTTYVSKILCENGARTRTHHTNTERSAACAS